MLGSLWEGQWAGRPGLQSPRGFLPGPPCSRTQQRESAAPGVFVPGLLPRSELGFRTPSRVPKHQHPLSISPDPFLRETFELKEKKYFPGLSFTFFFFSPATTQDFIYLLRCHTESSVEASEGAGRVWDDTAFLVLVAGLGEASTSHLLSTGKHVQGGRGSVTGKLSAHGEVPDTEGGLPDVHQCVRWQDTGRQLRRTTSGQVCRGVGGHACEHVHMCVRACLCMSIFHTHAPPGR